MFKSGVISIAGILLLLLLIVMIFLMFYPWMESIDNDLRVSLQEDTAEISIVSFKNNSLEFITDANIDVTSLTIENESTFCEYIDVRLNKPRDTFDLSSCSLQRGKIYTISVLLFNSVEQKNMVYR